MLEFEFNGHSSSEYGVIISSISDNDEIESRSLVLGQKNKYRAKENHFGTIYDNNYSFSITLIKDPCRQGTFPNVKTIKNNSTTYNALIYDEKSISEKDTLHPTVITNNNGYSTLVFPYNDKDVINGVLLNATSEYFTSNEIRGLNAWLLSPQFPKLFKFTNDNYYLEDIVFFATVTSVETENLGNPYQITYKFECDSPYGYSPLQNKIITSNSNFESNYSLTNFSDCHNDYIYPTVKFTPTKDSQITLINQTDNGKLIVNGKKDNVFYMDCQNLKLYGENDKLLTFNDVGVNGDQIDNIYWLRLAYGENNLKIKGDVNIEISYREPRKVGAFI